MSQRETPFIYKGFSDKNSMKVRQSEKGQAVMEYILILSVTVILIFGIFYQFSTAFKAYAESYFGDYVACLIEVGELPALGAVETTTKENCSAQYEEFSLANGRPLKEEYLNSGSGRSGGSASSNRTSRTEELRNRNRGKRSARGGRKKGVSEGSISPTNVRSNNSNRGGRNRLRTRTGNNKSRNLKFSTNDSPNKLGGGQLGQSTRFRLARRKKSTSYENQDGDGNGPISIYRGNRDTAEEGIDKIAGKQSEEESENDGSGTKKMKVQRDIAKAEVKGDLSFTLGDYLRYIIILGIVIAIVFVVGGQIMKAQKGME